MKVVIGTFFKTSQQELQSFSSHHLATKAKKEKKHLQSSFSMQSSLSGRTDLQRLNLPWRELKSFFFIQVLC
jgi:hypothetical protein